MTRQADLHEGLAAISGDYRSTGMALFRFMLPTEATKLAQEAYAIIRDRGRERTTADAPGALDIPRNAMRYLTAEDWPVLTGLYHGMRTMAELVTKEPLHVSPYKVGVVARLMDKEGDRDDWHVDSNPVSCVLYLTSHPKEVGDGQLQWIRQDSDPGIGGATFEHFPQAGDAAVFKGRRVFHRVPPLGKKGTTRLAVVFNFYTAEDYWRPLSLDGYLWGAR